MTTMPDDTPDRIEHERIEHERIEHERIEYERIEYDEFGLFHENAAEYGLRFDGPPTVHRTSVAVDGGRVVSALVWGEPADSPEIVFVHGGSQNAHTWDTTIMALGRAALAVDLPGHGHSDWRDDGAYSPMNLADDIAVAIDAHAPDARMIVGMSLGGLTTMELAVRHPHLVRRLMMIDITPGVNSAKTKAVVDFVNGPQRFPSFQSLLARTMEHNPTRSESSLRRGILHNAKQLDDGSWQWRYDRSSHGRATPATSTATSTATSSATSSATSPEEATDDTVAALSPLWDDFERISCPLTLVRGALSPVVDDDDVAEARRRQPNISVEVVEGAGHSVQGDRPVELAALIERTLG
jgi:pimeloyl-ACP methyl ester carboxylesterase